VRGIHDSSVTSHMRPQCFPDDCLQVAVLLSGNRAMGASIKSVETHASRRPHCSVFSLARCFWTRAFVVIFPLMIPTGLAADLVQETPALEVGVRSPRVGDFQALSACLVVPCTLFKTLS
jgi:hypothetical protein